MKIRCNWPMEIDPTESEVVVTLTVHAGEKGDHDYPGSDPYIEYLTVQDVSSGYVCDFFCLEPAQQDALRERCEETLREEVRD